MSPVKHTVLKGKERRLITYQTWIKTHRLSLHQNHLEDLIEHMLGSFLRGSDSVSMGPKHLEFS